MKIHEFQAKAILAGYGVPVPRGEVAVTAVEARNAAERLGGPVVVKAQITQAVVARPVGSCWHLPRAKQRPRRSGSLAPDSSRIRPAPKGAW